MKKTNQNQLLNPAIFFIMIAGLLALSCSLLAQPGASPTTTAALPASGSPVSLGGKAAVSVSDGVIILTPGQPYPTPVLELEPFCTLPHRCD